MNFPGTCKIVLTDAALMEAIQGAINAARREGEDYVYVTEIKREHYSYGDWVATVTTDLGCGEVVSITNEVAA